ncbi:MAG: hypothetical protein AB1798_09120 [Spirochaetota bacterium]
MKTLAKIITQYPVITILIIAGITGVLGYGLTKVRLATDITTTLPKDNPAVQAAVFSPSPC